MVWRQIANPASPPPAPCATVCHPTRADPTARRQQPGRARHLARHSLADGSGTSEEGQGGAAVTRHRTCRVVPHRQFSTIDRMAGGDVDRRYAVPRTRGASRRKGFADEPERGLVSVAGEERCTGAQDCGACGRGLRCSSCRVTHHLIEWPSVRPLHAAAWERAPPSGSARLSRILPAPAI